MVQNYALVYASVLISTSAVVAYVALFRCRSSFLDQLALKGMIETRTSFFSQQWDGSVSLFRSFYRPNCWQIFMPFYILQLVNPYSFINRKSSTKSPLSNKLPPSLISTPHLFRGRKWISPPDFHAFSSWKGMKIWGAYTTTSEFESLFIYRKSPIKSPLSNEPPF